MHFLVYQQNLMNGRNGLHTIEFSIFLHKKFVLTKILPTFANELLKFCN